MPADVRIAGAAVLAVVTGLCHLGAGELEATVVSGRSVWVIVDQSVVLEAVERDMSRNAARGRSPEEVQELLLVKDVADRLADVKVVERRGGQVHRQVNEEVA